MKTMSTSIFKIVEFEDGIQLVPTNWLTENQTHCYWPPATINQIKVNKLIANRTSPDKNWNAFSIQRIFGTSDNYTDGIFKLKQAEIHSELESGSDTECKKRSRHDRAAITFELNNEDLLCNSLTMPINKKKRKLSFDIPKTTSNSQEIIFPDFPSLSYENNPGNNFLNNMEDFEVDIIPSSKSISDLHSQQISTPSSKFFMDNQSKSSEKSSNNAVWRKEISKKMSKILLKCDMLQEQNDKIKNMVETLTKRLTANVDGIIDGINNLPPEIEFGLSYSSECSLLNAEKQLCVDNVYYSQMVNILKPIGGSDLISIVNNVMSKLMTNCLAISYSFIGKQKKKSFKDELPTHLRLIITVVRYHKPQVTNKEIHTQIAKWLVQSQIRKVRQEMKVVAATATVDAEN